MQTHTKELFSKCLYFLRPPLRLTVSEWADKFRYLSSEASAEPGRWNTNMTPYMREIMDSVDDGEIEDITIMSSAQVGKSEFVSNTLGKHIHLDPCPILLVQPTDNMAQGFSKERIAPMVRDTPVLKELIKDASKKDSGNTVSHKIFPGGYVAFVGANSPSKLASRPVRITLLDEVDRFPITAGKEGDPVTLAEKRTNNFWNRKKIKVSTPTVKGISRIDKAFQDSTMEEWCLPCPSCGTYNKLEWKRTKWDSPHSTVYMYCHECGVEHTEAEWKSKKQLNGKWIAEQPEVIGHRGFHLNELASPWKTWEQMRSDFLKAKKDPELLKTFINTSLGECWIENLGEKISWERLLERCEDYGADLHDDILILTAGIDVQDNRLELEVVGWGIDEEKYGVEYKIFVGSPAETDVWNQLDEYLNKEFSFADGNKLRIVSSCIDTGGHYTQEVYDFVKPRQYLKRLFGIKGQGGDYVPVINGLRKTKHGEIDLLSIGINALKDITYGSLKIETPGRNYCHFPSNINKGFGSEYFQSLTAEVKTMKNKKIVWEKTRERNEALDCRNYATAAFKLLNANLEKLSELSRERLASIGKPSRKTNKIKRKVHSKGVN